MKLKDLIKTKQDEKIWEKFSKHYNSYASTIHFVPPSKNSNAYFPEELLINVQPIKSIEVPIEIAFYLFKKGFESALMEIEDEA